MYDAAQDAFVKGERFADLLAGEARVAAQIDAAAIARLLEPSAYTGLCAKMARDAAGRARAVAGAGGLAR